MPFSLQFAVSAVEQLQVMASRRQYKEAAAQLEVTYFLIIALFLFNFCGPVTLCL